MMVDKKTINATVEQRDKVGMAYISKILGLGDEIASRFREIANRFALGDQNFMPDELRIIHEVGRKQSAVPIATNTADFWQEVKKILPEYTDHDVSVLGVYGVDKVFDFLFMLGASTLRSCDSPVLRVLAINMHQYRWFKNP